MYQDTYQLKKWKSGFGKKYTDRNTLTLSNLEKLYKKRYGLTRMQMNKTFLGNLDRSIRILEVGSNIGNQLQLLKRMGFKNLYGIEPQEYAVELSKKIAKGINIINGNVFDIPFKDGYFDLVFTSGVLIHINPQDIKRAMKEICRCSKTYIWGFEYYSPKYRKIKYRREDKLLWKGDFRKMYTNIDPVFKTVKEDFFDYIEEESTDTMFLLKR